MKTLRNLVLSVAMVCMLAVPAWAGGMDPSSMMPSISNMMGMAGSYSPLRSQTFQWTVPGGNVTYGLTDFDSVLKTCNLTVTDKDGNLTDVVPLPYKYGVLGDSKTPVVDIVGYLLVPEMNEPTDGSDPVAKGLALIPVKTADYQMVSVNGKDYVIPKGITPIEFDNVANVEDDANVTE